MTPLLAVLAVSIAVLILGVLAHDFGVRWLSEQRANRVAEFDALACSKRLDDLELTVKKLAEDWFKRFQGLEAQWKQLEKHGSTQIAGAVAQVESQQRKGFGR